MYWGSSIPDISMFRTGGEGNSAQKAPTQEPRGPKTEAGDSDDDSRWSTEGEFLEGLSGVDIASDDEIPVAGVPLAEVDGRVFYDPGEVHTIVYGTTGSKKSFGVGIPFCCVAMRAGESFFVTDTKGDVLYSTYDGLIRHGYRVIVFDLRKPERSLRWNPLDLPYKLHKSERQTDRDKAQEMLLNIAECLCPVSQKDPFWDLSAQSVIYGLCNVLFNTCTDVSKINFRSVCSLKSALLEKDWELESYLESSLCTPAEHDSLMVTEGNSDVTRRCILSVFDRALSPFTSQDMVSWLTAATDFDFADLGRGRTAMFVISPDEDSTYDFLISMMITQCYKRLVSVAQSSPGRRLETRVNFILDEFGNLPAVQDLGRMITASRSRNMRFLLLLQDRSQLEYRYGEALASTIMSNCGNIMYLNGRDLSLIEDLSRLSGTDSEGKRVVSTSRLQRLDKEKGEVFILRDRKRPYISTLPFATKYAQYAVSEPEFPVREREEVPVFDVDTDFNPYWKDVDSDDDRSDAETDQDPSILIYGDGSVDDGSGSNDEDHDEPLLSEELDRLFRSLISEGDD